MPEPTHLPTDAIAAIDLGSNSFHMIIARMVDGQLQVIDRLKEMVQLALGLDERRVLSAEASLRALDCLTRFGQRLRGLPAERVRVVGTNTLRQARNSQAFLLQAETAIGYPIEVISGIEEARLIYLGVAHSTASEGRRLVIDIGGGSTELIIGEQFAPLQMESLYMGCVGMTRKHFASERIRESALAAAEIEVRQELGPIEATYRQLGWNTVIGASGSVRAIHDVVTQEGWSREGITRTALRRLRNALRDLGSASTIAERWQLGKERAAVFAGGFVVLYGVCETLDIERLQVSDGALREGVIYDLLGRIRHEDVRDRTIAILTRRYGVNEAQAERVAGTARHFLAQAKVAWELTDERYVHDLDWAARLHEIGLAIAHSHYHKHGAYIIEHADLPGFSRSEQTFIATLVRGHRRKLPLAEFEALPKKLAISAQRLCILLRLAVLLHRGHLGQDLPPIGLQIRDKTIELWFPAGWLDENPLTSADLEAEAQHLQRAGYQLAFYLD